MLVFCEECGERYIIEDEDIEGSEMIFICKVCNDIIRVPVQENRSKHSEKTKKVGGKKFKPFKRKL